MSDMNYFVARMLVEERMREANQLHRAREARRGDQPATVASPARKPRRLPRLWSLVHLRQAHS